MKRKMTMVLLICFALIGLSVFTLTAYSETWSQVNTDGFGDSNNYHAIPLVVFNGYLYAGTENTVSGAEVWRTADGITWTQVNSDGFGDVNNIFAFLFLNTVFNGRLYVGTWNPVTGVEIWRSSDGTTWTQVNTDGFGAADNIVSWDGEVFNGYLYVGTQNSITGTEVWRTLDGTTWTQVNTDGFGDPNNEGTAEPTVFNGHIYFGTVNQTTGGEVWRSADGATWTQVDTDGFGDANNRVIRLHSVGGHLYAATVNPVTGAEVWRTPDGTSWTQVNTDGFGDASNRGAKVLIDSNGYLYAGTDKLPSSGAEVWRTADGTNWAQVDGDGFGDANNHRIFPLVVFNGKLFVGTRNDVTGGEMWALSYDNTPTGSYVNVDLGGGVDLTFDTVSSNGSTSLTTITNPPSSAPPGFKFLDTYYDISTDVSFTGPIQVTLPYDESEIEGNEADLKLFHWNGTSWEDVTVSVDTTNNTITGETTALSPFAIAMSSPQTGVNTYTSLILGLLAMVLGVGVMRKVRFLRV